MSPHPASHYVQKLKGVLICMEQYVIVRCTDFNTQRAPALGTQDHRFQWVDSFKHAIMSSTCMKVIIEMISGRAGTCKFDQENNFGIPIFKSFHV
jgi:hypothetical protein